MGSVDTNEGIVRLAVRGVLLRRRRGFNPAGNPAMRRSLLAAVAATVSLASAAYAADPSCGWASGGCAECSGGYPPTMLQGGHDSFEMNRRWPKQYIQPSRRAICQVTATMVNNGWRRQNLLGAHHFDPRDPQQLSEAGKRKTEWILTQAPPDRRSVFVERSADPAETADRVQAVQGFAANINIAAADVQETNLRNEGHPAGTVDAVFTGFSANQPPPILPEASAGGESSGE